METPEKAARPTAAIFGGVAFARTGFIAAITVSSLVAEDMLGSAAWSGLPAAATTVGIAAGTTLLAMLMARTNRRLGLVTGYSIAVVAAGLAAFATAAGIFALFVLALVLIGVGHSANHLARYAAADLHPARRRATVISLIVWAGTIGAVVGPALLEPAENVAERVGIAGLAGPYLLGLLGFAAAAVMLLSALRRDAFADPVADTRPDRLPLRSLLAGRGLAVPVVVMVASQFVMVLIMTMTPVHIRDAGETLGAVGIVISAHTLGMFALAPLSGFLADRWGRAPVIVAGAAMLAGSSLLAAFAEGQDRSLLVVSLFLLGLGWSFGFVGGSALLTDLAGAADRVRVQGAADSLVWVGGASASLSSGFLLEAGGFATLSLIGAALALVPLVAILRRRVAVPVEA